MRAAPSPPTVWRIGEHSKISRLWSSVFLPGHQSILHLLTHSYTKSTKRDTESQTMCHNFQTKGVKLSKSFRTRLARSRWTPSLESLLVTNGCVVIEETAGSPFGTPFDTQPTSTHLVPKGSLVADEFRKTVLTGGVVVDGT